METETLPKRVWREPSKQNVELFPRWKVTGSGAMGRLSEKGLVEREIIPAQQCSRQLILSDSETFS